MKKIAAKRPSFLPGGLYLEQFQLVAGFIANRRRVSLSIREIPQELGQIGPVHGSHLPTEQIADHVNLPEPGPLSEGFHHGGLISGYQPNEFLEEEDKEVVGALEQPVVVVARFIPFSFTG